MTVETKFLFSFPFPKIWSNNTILPNESIRLILLYCQTSKDYLSQSLLNRQWLYEAHRLRSIMKARFSRKIELFNYRFLIWDFDARISVIGHNKNIQRHGLEEIVQTYHRVGGPTTDVYYLERHWQDGKLHGLEILREINSIWYTKYYRNQVEESNNEIIFHPYGGLLAVDSMKKYGRHCLALKSNTIPHGCDYLGRIVFKHEWISVTLEESEQIRRNLINNGDDEKNELKCLYDFVSEMDLCKISL